MDMTEANEKLKEETGEVILETVIQLINHHKVIKIYLNIYYNIT